MKKRQRILLVFSVSVALICGFFSLFSLYLRKATIQLNGFAVDSAERLYIGKEGRIEVYDDGALQYTVSPRTDRAYAFTITDRDVLIVSTVEDVYEMDLTGQTVYREYEDPSFEIYKRLQGIDTFTSANGNTYTLKNQHLRYAFVKNDTQTVYVMPLYDFIVKITFFVGVFLGFADGIFVLLHLDVIVPMIRRQFGG